MEFAPADHGSVPQQYHSFLYTNVDLFYLLLKQSSGKYKQNNPLGAFFLNKLFK